MIRWGDIVNVQGFDIDVQKAVELGKEHGLSIAEKLEEDLKSDTGLLITFPIAILMSQLQEKVGTGEKLLDLVKQ